MRENRLQERIRIVQGDIPRMQVDAIVNAANKSLLGGGGVDGAIHRAAGPRLLEECRRLGGCETGAANLTQGYDLPAKWVIDTGGPVWRGGAHEEDRLLAACYRNCLLLAQQKNIRSIAFPAISTGVYGFPVARAARIALSEVQKHCLQNPVPEKVTLVCFDAHTYQTYMELLGP